ncbi:hypothetical protein V6N12_049141 [Hibiscus sabdariffa]|uniref:Uncharacterized protein n=1 Tax=Hibiscus sabdariffa TaxID=183260 RepID=A0ABR2EJB6_9ROSI
MIDEREIEKEDKVDESGSIRLLQFWNQSSMLLLLLCKCFDVLPKQDDKGDASNRDNGSCLSRNLGGDSDLAGLLSAETCTPSSLLRAWALGLVFEWSRPPLDALLVLGCSGEYSDENKIPFLDSFLLPGQKISTGNLL